MLIWAKRIMWLRAELITSILFYFINHVIFKLLPILNAADRFKCFKPLLDSLICIVILHDI